MLSMDLKKCDMDYLNTIANMYEKVVENLQKHINYPKWSKNYPNYDTVKNAILKGEQYACTDGNNLLGAVILNENPQGNYDAGHWSKNLDNGEYLVIHTLAVNPAIKQKWRGSHIVDCCINFAKTNHYKAIRIDVVPGNIPAINLYKRKGFTFAGNCDLSRNIKDIPFFDLFELNFE